MTSLIGGIMRPGHYMSVAIAGFALVMPVLAFGNPIVFSASGASANDIQAKVDDFRAALGGANNGNIPGPVPTGRREINWDGITAPDVLLNMPLNLFQNRGVFFEFDFTAFSISGVATPRFGNVNANYPDIFTTFSAPRLFSPTSSNVTELIFFVPGTGTSATTSGFGAVFTDVDLADTTKIQYIDRNTSLGTFSVPPANNGLSFVGVVFDGGERISHVRIVSGNTKLGPNDQNGDSVDVVVMDDFIYGEPQPTTAAAVTAAVPEPASLLLLGSGLLALAVWRQKIRMLAARVR